MPFYFIGENLRAKEYDSMADACAANPGKDVAELDVDEGEDMEDTREELPMDPMGNRIIVERFKLETTYGEGLLVIPDSYQNPAAEGTVIAAGPGRLLDDGSRVMMEVQVGDKVFFQKYSGSEIKIKGKDCLVMTDAEVIARIK